MLARPAMPCQTILYSSSGFTESSGLWRAEQLIAGSLSSVIQLATPARLSLTAAEAESKVLLLTRQEPKDESENLPRMISTRSR